MSDPDADSPEGHGIEVGRYGLRTFRIDPKLRVLLPVSRHAVRHSTTSADEWNGGVCVARCHRHADHIAPAEDCSCGVYAATDLLTLYQQYGFLARDVVAVIAAEGPTVIGDRGMRTSGARVVAYWVRSNSRLHTTATILAEQCPDAAVYTDLDDLLRDYRLRATPPPEDERAAASAAPKALLASVGHHLSSALSAGVANYYNYNRGFALRRRARALCFLLLVPALIGYCVGEMVLGQRHGELRADPASTMLTAFADLWRSVGVLLDAAVSSPATAPNTLTLGCVVALLTVVGYSMRVAPVWVEMAHRGLRACVAVPIRVGVMMTSYCWVTGAVLHWAMIVVACAAAVLYALAPGGAVVRTVYQHWRARL